MSCANEMERWKICTCIFLSLTISCFYFILVFLALPQRMALLENLPALLSRAAVLLFASDVRGEWPRLYFLPWKSDAGRWERDRTHLLIEGDTNCLLTLQSGERWSRKLLGYCWQLFRSRKWTELRRKRASQVWDGYPSPSSPPSRCSQLQAGSQEHKHAQQRTGAQLFVIKTLAKLMGSCWQILSNPIIVIRICWRNSSDKS